MDPVTVLMLCVLGTEVAARQVRARKMVKRKNELGYEGQQVAIVSTHICMSDKLVDQLDELGATDVLKQMLEEGRYIQDGEAA